MSIVIGTKVEATELGERVDVCPGCLLATRHVVNRSTSAIHIQLITVSTPKEVLRFSECQVCGVRQECSPEAVFKHRNIPLHELAQATNAGTLSLRPETIEEAVLGSSLCRNDRIKHSCQCFLEMQYLVLESVVESVGGWLCLMNLLYGALCIYMFSMWGPIWGTAGIVGLSFARWRLRRHLLYRGVAEVSRPRLARFLEVHQLSLSEFRQYMYSDIKPLKRLTRHFHSEYYDGLAEATPTSDNVAKPGSNQDQTSAEYFAIFPADHHCETLDQRKTA